MDQTSLRTPRTLRRTIDITPGAGWRRGLRRAGVALVLALALPVLWLLGALTLLGLLGGAAALLLWGAARQAAPSRARFRHGHGSDAGDER